MTIFISFSFDELDTFVKIIKSGFKESVKKYRSEEIPDLYTYSFVFSERPVIKVSLNEINYQYFLRGLKKFSKNKNYRSREEGYEPRKEDFIYKIENQ